MQSQIKVEDFSVPELIVYAKRYAYLRERDLDTLVKGGVFAGKTPENVVLSGNDLDEVIDAAIALEEGQ